MTKTIRRDGLTHTERNDQVHPPGGEPRLPHERDESSDSQPMPVAPNDAPIRQGARDVERGLVDTDEARRAHVVQGPPAPGHT